MSDLDDFRPRLVNWARVYRDPMPVKQSPYYKDVEVKEGNAEPTFEPDYRDAEFIDKCITALRHQSFEFEEVFRVIKAEYLVHYSSASFDSEEAAFRAKKKRAAYAQVFHWRYDESLQLAETLLMNFVAKKEHSSEFCAIVPFRKFENG